MPSEGRFQSGGKPPDGELIQMSKWGDLNGLWSALKYHTIMDSALSSADTTAIRGAKMREQSRHGQFLPCFKYPLLEGPHTDSNIQRGNISSIH